ALLCLFAILVPSALALAQEVESSTELAPEPEPEEAPEPEPEPEEAPTPEPEPEPEPVPAPQEERAEPEPTESEDDAPDPNAHRGDFHFGSYGRVIVASDLEGRAGRPSNVVTFGPRADEVDTYAEIELRREDHFAGVHTQIVATIAYGGP